jgi:hypothetical protein
MGTIKLSASADYGLSGQYVARILGRNSKFTFNREFIGSKSGKRGEFTSATVDDAGLYEARDVTRKGKLEHYLLVIEVDGELKLLKSDLDDAMKIAKALDDGRSIQNIVRYNANNPAADYDILTPAQAAKASVASTVETAIEICWAALEPLPPKEAKRVLAALRAKLNPPKAEGEESKE